MTYARQLKFLDLVLKNNKVPHAFLFYGRDEPFQKKLAASFFARLNNLDESVIVGEAHPDTFFARRPEDKKEIPISQIRALRSFVVQSPLALAHKGVFVESAQHMNEEGWNALLKTLEEPAAGTVIFILAKTLKRMPATIVSRAVVLPFDSPDPSRQSNLPKDDIILNKLCNLAQLSIVERFKLAEDVSKKDNAADVLDSWMLDLRIKMLEDGDNRAAKILEAAARLKDRLLNTNINARLALEVLFLKI